MTSSLSGVREALDVSQTQMENTEQIFQEINRSVSGVEDVHRGINEVVFNYFYLKKITQQVNIQRYRGHAAAGTQQYYQNLSRMGGTSWLSVFLIVIGLLSVSSLVTSLFLM